MLAQLRDEVEDVERTNDWQTKQRVISLLVAGIRVRTEGQGRRKQAHLTLRYTFGQPVAVDLPTACLTPSTTRSTRATRRRSPSSCAARTAAACSSRASTQRPAPSGRAPACPRRPRATPRPA